ncbi:MAG: rRNA maturation RNase YbeY [Candidatus Acidiferrales bacterium]
MSAKIPGRPTRSIRHQEYRPRDVVLNCQRNLRIPKRELEQFLARARHALRLPAGSLSVALVTNAAIAKWNHAYRHKAGPTDVLSFPAEAEPESGRRSIHRFKRGRSEDKAGRTRDYASDTGRPLFYFGDIAIAPAVARRNARRFRRTFSQEMRILILHGMLHLMGYDHETDTGQMERRERRLRRKLGLV